MMAEKPKPIGDQIRQIITNQKNKPIVDQIMGKMGRLLAKKQSLSEQRPVAIEPRLWLGNYLYANDRQFLLENNIKTVISCLQLPLNHCLPQIQYLKFALKDEKDSRFEQMIPLFINRIGQSKGNVLVHCFSGKSRSVSLTLGYLMNRDRCNYDQALERLRNVYPLASPNEHFATTLKRLQEKLMSQSKVIEQDLLSHEPRQAEQIIELQILPKQIKAQSQSLIQLGEEQKVHSPSKIEHSLLDFNEIEPTVEVEHSNESRPQLQKALKLIDNGLPSDNVPQMPAEIKKAPQNQQELEERLAQQVLTMPQIQTNTIEDLLDLNQSYQEQTTVQKRVDFSKQIQSREIKIEHNQVTTNFQHEEKPNQPKKEIIIQEDTAEFIVYQQQQQQVKPEISRAEQKKEEEQLIQHADFTQKKKRNKKKKK